MSAQIQTIYPDFFVSPYNCKIIIKVLNYPKLDLPVSG